MRVPIPGSPVGSTLVYVFVGPNGLTMVDTGSKLTGTYDTLSAQFGKLTLDLRDVRQIVLTHMHTDHTGLVNQIREVSGAKVFLHEADAPAVKAIRNPTPPPFAVHGIPQQVFETSRFLPSRRVLRPCPEPDELLREGNVIRAGDFELEVVWTPGHTLGHICLYERSRKLLFSGDHVLPARPSVVSSLMYGANSPDPLGDYLSSLAKLKPLEVETVLPAHEHAFRDLPGRLREIDRYYEARLQEMLAAIGGEWATAYDVSQKVTWTVGDFAKVGSTQKFLLVGETVAHLEYLCRQEQLTKRNEGGVVYYGGV